MTTKPRGQKATLRCLIPLESSSLSLTPGACTHFASPRPCSVFYRSSVPPLSSAIRTGGWSKLLASAGNGRGSRGASPSPAVTFHLMSTGITSHIVCILSGMAPGGRGDGGRWREPRMAFSRCSVEQLDKMVDKWDHTTPWPLYAQWAFILINKE